METGKKVKLKHGVRMTRRYGNINISDFEVWTGRDSEEFYDR